MTTHSYFSLGITCPMSTTAAIFVLSLRCQSARPQYSTGICSGASRLGIFCACTGAGSRSFVAGARAGAGNTPFLQLPQGARPRRVPSCRRRPHARHRCAAPARPGPGTHTEAGAAERGSAGSSCSGAVPRGCGAGRRRTGYGGSRAGPDGCARDRDCASSRARRARQRRSRQPDSTSCASTCPGFRYANAPSATAIVLFVWLFLICFFPQSLLINTYSSTLGYYALVV